MKLKNREGRSAAFDAVAKDYEAARPGYPDDAIATLVKACRLTSASTCLEVGVGTGQATREIAALECPITGLEPGPNLARVAAEILSSFPNVSIVNESFEDFSASGEAFDLVYSATAFHWTDPATRWQRAARALKPGGHIAILTNKSMESEVGSDFYLAAKPIFQTYQGMGRGTQDHTNTTVAAAHALAGELMDGELFEVILEESFAFDLSLTTNAIIALHKTYSDLLLMAERDRLELLGALGNLADEQFGGLVVKPYETSLVVARKL